MRGVVRISVLHDTVVCVPIGGSGPDTLDANADTVDAAGGGDVIDARDGTRDEIACGAGHDTLLRDSADPRPASCEKIVS